MLAAGLSSRMVSWKMLLPWRDTTILDCTLRTALSFCDQVILVTGFRGAELHQRYHGLPRIRLSYNIDYRSGMFSSLRCGAHWLANEPFFVIPGDMPDIRLTTYKRLWAAHPAPESLVPVYNHRGGHPVLLPALMRSTILNAPTDSNLGQLIRIYGRRNVEVDDPAIHYDLDTPDEYRQRYQSGFNSDRIF
ncbi:hypothetical protein TUM12370_15940 [Salmonella enterica subsp. enterica serovar Choleraesuis]|nr:hypothetical protein TUM12370_15940 [Salmonella enterica subsp. enterica serovar Choleraesuis]